MSETGNLAKQIPPFVDRVFTSPQIVPVQEMLFRSLRDSAGSSDLRVDGSVTPVSFRYTVPTGKIAIISRMLTHIVDSGMQWQEFAGITALTNGLTIKALDVDDSVLLDFIDGNTIQNNGDWSHVAGSDEVLQLSAGPDLLAIRWSLFKTGFVPFLEEGQSFEVLVQDDLSTGIDVLSILIQGREVIKSI